MHSQFNVDNQLQRYHKSLFLEISSLSIVQPFQDMAVRSPIRRPHDAICIGMSEGSRENTYRRSSNSSNSDLFLVEVRI